MDTLGLLIAVVVSSVKVQVYHGAKPVLVKLKDRCPRLKVVWVEGIYEKEWLIDWVRTECGWDLQVIKRTDKDKRFKLLLRRCVERKFGLLGGIAGSA